MDELFVYIYINTQSVTRTGRGTILVSGWDLRVLGESGVLLFRHLLVHRKAPRSRDCPHIPPTCLVFPLPPMSTSPLPSLSKCSDQWLKFGIKSSVHYFWIWFCSLLRNFPCLDCLHPEPSNSPTPTPTTEGTSVPHETPSRQVYLQGVTTFTRCVTVTGSPVGGRCT